MKRLLYITTIILLTNVCNGQTNIWGLYVHQLHTWKQLDLRPDQSYIYYNYLNNPTFVGSGSFSIIADTLFLQSKTEKENIEKYLITSMATIQIISLNFANTA